ncbi:MAG: zinc ribbon domain-containing protein [Dehalococcoidia bacterium]|nr:zinc ribbon domain-containing protein [Dehalococcoidia bacterium]
MYLMEWPGGSWQATAWGVAFLIGAYLAAFWLALVFWTARDARQRTGSFAAQMAAALLVLSLFLPGLFIYLMVRPRRTLAQRYAQMLEEEALRLELDREVACPACSRRIRDDYLVCPACLTELKQACGSCTRPLANAWRVCPYCMAERTPEPLPAPAPAFRPEAVPVAPPTAVVGAISPDVSGLAS